MERIRSDSGFSSYAQTTTLNEGEVTGNEPSRIRSNTWPSAPCHGAGCKSPKSDQDRVSSARDGKESTTATAGGPRSESSSAACSAKTPTTTGSRKNPWGGLSYAELITMAIESSPEKRMTLSELYDWMVKNVPYFSDKGDSFSSAGWKNSIRHNLSLHSRFVRVVNETTGKSSWWMVNHDMKPGLTSRRRATSMDTKVFERKRGRLRKKMEELSGQCGGGGMGNGAAAGGGGGTAEVDSTTPSPPRVGYARNFYEGALARHRTGNGFGWLVPDFSSPNKHQHPVIIPSSLEPTLEESIMNFPHSHFQDPWTDQRDHLLTMYPETSTCDVVTSDNSKPVSECLAEVIAGNLNMCEREVVTGIDYLFEMPSMERQQSDSRGWSDTCSRMDDLISVDERLTATGFPHHENDPMDDCMLVDRGMDEMLAMDYSNQAPPPSHPSQCFDRRSGMNWTQESTCFPGNGIYSRDKEILHPEDHYVHPELRSKPLGSSRWISQQSMHGCTPRKISVGNGVTHPPGSPLMTAAYVQSYNRRRIPSSLNGIVEPVNGSSSSGRPYLQYALDSSPSRPYPTRRIYRGDDVHSISGAWTAPLPGQMYELEFSNYSNHEWGSTPGGQLGYSALRLPQFYDDSRSMDVYSFSHRDLSSSAAQFSPFRSK